MDNVLRRLTQLTHQLGWPLVRSELKRKGNCFLNTVYTWYRVLRNIQRHWSWRYLDLVKRWLTQRPPKVHKCPGDDVTRLVQTGDVWQCLGRTISHRTPRLSSTKTDHCGSLGHRYTFLTRHEHRKTPSFKFDTSSLMSLTSCSSYLSSLMKSALRQHYVM